jgi:hypothetical protein
MTKRPHPMKDEGYVWGKGNAPPLYFGLIGVNVNNPPYHPPSTRLRISALSCLSLLPRQLFTHTQIRVVNFSTRKIRVILQFFHEVVIDGD